MEKALRAWLCSGIRARKGAGQWGRMESGREGRTGAPRGEGSCTLQGCDQGGARLWVSELGWRVLRMDGLRMVLGPDFDLDGTALATP